MNEFETSVVNEPSVFDPLKFYYTCIRLWGASGGGPQLPNSLTVLIPEIS